MKKHTFPEEQPEIAEQPEKKPEINQPHDPVTQPIPQEDNPQMPNEVPQQPVENPVITR